MFHMHTFSKQHIQHIQYFILLIPDSYDNICLCLTYADMMQIHN